MLIERVAIGHPGDVIGDDARCRCGPRTMRERTPLGWQALRLREQKLEQLLNDAMRLRGHAVEAVVTVHAIEEKPAQIPIMLIHRAGKADNGAAEIANF